MQLPWTKTRNQTDVPDQRDYWSSHRHTAHNSSAAPPTSHTPAFPPTQPSVQYQYPYYPPQQHYEQLQSYDRPQPVAGPFGSRGRDYLQSLSTDLSNLDLERIGPSGTGHHTRSHSSPKPSLEKPLPSTPRYPSAPPPHDPLRGNTTSPLVYSTPPLPRPPRLVWETDEHGAALGTQETGPPCVSQTIHDVHKQQSSPSSSALQKQDSTTSGAYPVTPPRAFKPSRYLASPSVLLAPHSEPRLSRPKSDLVVPTRKTHTTVKKANKSKSSGALRKPIIIIDSESDKSDSDSYVPSIIDIPDTVTNRSPARRKRATSEIPCGPGKTSSSPKPPRVTANTPNTVSGKCAGFTRKGQPCQRLVRDAAPLLMLLDTNTPQEERITARYCKDHAGMICNVKGFYWRLSAESEGIWVDFAHFIPDDLGQQTQALLRMAMESPLTDKEASGYLYAYELRDLNTHETSFFKVGRTDNVPRRIGEWTTRCRRHTPTLRDIFPSSMSPSRRVHESGVSLNRNPSAPTSFLPGALRHSTNPHRTCPAVKRWERLVHLELADRSSSTASEEYLSLKQRCEECDAVHREIFPLGKQDRVYEDTIREVICRWERFIRQICQDA